jgi:hypothetical protein
MRTISVKEAAQALGLSNRAVIYRLQSGDLRGHQSPNPYGVNEWRIYPTKEIAQKLRLKDNNETPEVDFSPHEDTIDVETVGEEVNDASAQQVWIESERKHMRLIAEEMMKPLLDTIRDQERLIEEQSRKIKLLPDFEKQAETEHKAAEIKALEAEALRKQIAAMQLEREEAELAKAKIETLEKQLEEHRVAAEAELERLKQEKEAQIKVAEEQVFNLSQTLQELKQPWWKKLFAAPTEQ